MAIAWHFQLIIENNKIIAENELFFNDSNTEHSMNDRNKNKSTIFLIKRMAIYENITKTTSLLPM
jgi:hypothetical protein